MKTKPINTLTLVALCFCSLFAFLNFTNGSEERNTVNESKERVSSKETATKPPNVILIVADDLGYADMSFLPFASKDVKTPGIDRLAKNSISFTNAYATAPICSPARAGLATGRYQQRWGNFWFGQGGLPSEEMTLAQALKKVGYVTKKIGKTHMNGGPAEHPMKHGFDEHFGFIDHTWDYIRLSEKDVEHYGKKHATSAHIGPLERNGKKVSYEDSYTTELFTEDAVEYIKRKHAQPFFLQVSYNAVHHPTYVGHPNYLKKYGLEQFPFWDPKKEPWGERRYKNSWHSKWGHLGEVDPDGRKRYLATLDCMDDGITAIQDALVEENIDGETVIIFLSDNGGTINTYSSNGPLHGYKYTFEEGGIRTPLLIKAPGNPNVNKSSDALVSHMDVLPTLLDLVDQKKPGNIDGKSLAPFIQQPLSEKHHVHHDYLCWASGRGDWVVRQGDWKLYHSKGKALRNFKIEDGTCIRDDDYPIAQGTRLYNLKEDLGETTDLSNDKPEKHKALSEIYNAWQQNVFPARKKKKGK